MVSSGLFTVYDKHEAADLTPKQRKLLADRLKEELRQRETAKGKKS